MKRLLSWFVCVVVLLTFSAGAVAGTTVLGPSGLIKVPTADALTAGELSFAYHLEDERGVGSLAYGLTDSIELGVYTKEKVLI